MINMLRKFRRDQSGATIIEYALIAGFISMTVLSLSSVIADAFNSIFDTVKINDLISPAKDPGKDTDDS